MIPTPARSARWSRLPSLSPQVGSTAVAVSVCIANWNCRNLLRSCLQSLRAQSVSLELIVVDNGSTDGAADMVAEAFPEVILIRNQANRGFAAANNQAAAQAQGRYLFFLNNDTVVPPETLAKLVEFADAHPDAGLIGPRLRDGRGAIQASARAVPTPATFLHRTLLLRWTGLFRKRYRNYRRRPHLACQPCSVEVLMGAAMLVRRDVLESCGGWDESYRFGGEDMDLCRRIRRQHRIVYHPGIELTHYGRVSTRLNHRVSAVHIPVGFVRFFRQSGCSRWQLMGYKSAVCMDAMLQCVVKGLQYALRRWRGQEVAAARSLEVVRHHWCFLTHGLAAFWKA